MHPESTPTRRTFLKHAGTLAALPLVAPLLPGTEPAPFRISVFTKHLGEFGYDDLAALAAESGFEGLDLTVRPGGHVLPERVTDDLPRAVDAARKAGIAVPMIVTALTGTDSPQAEAILRTAAAQGVTAYRTGWLDYDLKQPIEKNVAMHRTTLAGLAKLNERYRIHGAYQNHSGLRFGAPVWDLAQLLSDQDARYLGCQYDLHHATIEGLNSWVLGFRQVVPFVRTMDVKDFRWTNASGKWKNEPVPLGEGLVNFPALFKLVKEFGIQPQLSLHVEYPLPTTTDRTERRRQFVALMKKDLSVLHGWLREAGLR
jgi:sugar phosphate isomerase/epimerase